MGFEVFIGHWAEKDPRHDTVRGQPILHLTLANHAHELLLADKAESCLSIGREVCADGPWRTGHFHNHSAGLVLPFDGLTTLLLRVTVATTTDGYKVVLPGYRIVFGRRHGCVEGFGKGLGN